MKAKIYVTLKKTVLDPQGKAVLNALHSLGFDKVQDTRVGRYIELELKERNKKEAEQQIHKMCDELLANPVIEEYSFEITD
jgi:phosphoribosylformylglycinamidine synthase subunit PurS